MKYRKVETKFADFCGGINLPVTFKATVGRNIEPCGLQNVDFDDGLITKRKGFRTFKGMVKIMNDLNNKYKKMKIRGTFTITLPLRGSMSPLTISKKE
jgi:hypothetical protein